ncbi:MAG: hypothetical protein LUQ66_00420 [Methanoregula sp.]|nr:hypothetical protein [Methanoregula sp.]
MADEKDKKQIKEGYDKNQRENQARQEAEREAAAREQAEKQYHQNTAEGKDSGSIPSNYEVNVSGPSAGKQKEKR